MAADMTTEATSDYCSIISNSDADSDAFLEFLGNTNSHLCDPECSGDLRNYCDVITQHIASFLDATHSPSVCHQVSCSKNPADGSTHIYINVLDRSDVNKVKSTRFWTSQTSCDLDLSSECDLGSRPQCLGKEATPDGSTLSRSNITCLTSPGPRCNITSWLQDVDHHGNNSPQTDSSIDQQMAPCALSGHGLLHATSVDNLKSINQYHPQTKGGSTTKHRSFVKSFKKFLSRLHKK